MTQSQNDVLFEVETLQDWQLSAASDVVVLADGTVVSSGCNNCSAGDEP